MQGDERDVIILSVGYGPDSQGKLTMSFGPLNRENGWRRLNVAITRARRRVEVVSSISSSDIRESDNRSRNLFKKYLDFAARGPCVLGQAPDSPDADPESPFEESVLDVLEEWGYDVQPQVGVAGYRVDLGIRHPDEPGRYAIGIECDGVMYHSSRAARDRDRLREQQLRGLGWNLYRIWGTDWYRDRDGAKQRLRAAIEAAITRRADDTRQAAETLPEGEPLAAAGIPVADAEADVRIPPETTEPRVTLEAVDRAAREWGLPYKSAHHALTSLMPSLAVADLADPFSRNELCVFLSAIIEVEAPVHREVLFRRIAEAKGTKIGSRIRKNLNEALRRLVRSDPRFIRDGDVFGVAGREIVPRSPGDDVKRGIPEIPPVERGQVLHHIVRESPGISQLDLIAATVRFFGWQRTMPAMSQLLEEDLRKLADDGLIAGLPERIVLREGH